MKKIFTLVLGLCGLAGAVNAATIDDVKVCKHSYVLVGDDVTNNGTVVPTTGSLFGDGYFLNVSSTKTATNKGTVNLSDASVWGDDAEAMVAKYGSYGGHLNSLFVKNNQCVIAMKVTAGSKLIIFSHGNSKKGTDARYPKFATDASLTNLFNAAPDANHATTDAKTRTEFTATDDMTLYIGSWNGDIYISYIIVEAVEAPGTPTVKVGAQSFDNGLYFRDVTCTPVEVEGNETVVTYTTDGSDPTCKSTQYTEPIRCYNDQTIKFQAYYALDDEEYICKGADNEANVSFSFNAPTISADGGNVAIVSEYETAKNYYSCDGGEYQEGSNFTLSSSANITAYSTIVNGTYATFTTKSTTKDVYVLNPLKSEVSLSATGTVSDSLDTANGNVRVYYNEDGKIDCDPMSFYVKNACFGVISSEVDSVKKYQIDDRQVYIKMSDTNISFLVDEKDSVDIVVTCSKNSCKNIYDASSANWLCYVNVDGTVHGDSLCTPATKADLSAYKNVIEFSVGAGIHTFQKYSGTGNILISSIKFTPRIDCLVGIKNLVADKKVANKKYMLNGRLVIETANGTFDAAGVRVK